MTKTITSAADRVAELKAEIDRLNDEIAELFLEGKMEEIAELEKWLAVLDELLEELEERRDELDDDLEKLVED